jgi:radical SAM protein with 4Fe4S-binding SPASM domain
VKILSYTDFSSKIHTLFLRKRIPLDVSLELTYRCNNRCVHCYCNLPSNNTKALEEELTTEEIKKILNELSSMGSLWLLITGGEPILRNDFAEIYLYAKKKGFLITLFTNGTLLDKKTVDLLAAYPPFVVEISRYGATKKTYEEVSRVKGSYDRCIEGIKMVINSGVKVKLKSMALSLNQHEIEAMDRMAKEFGCEFRFDSIIQKRIDNSTYSTPEQYRISPEEVVKLDMMFPERMESYREFCKEFIGKPQDNKLLYQCGAGRGSIHINPYGMAMGCMMMIKDGFSIREFGLKWIWEEGIASVINQKKDFTLPCDDCDLINLCGQCPAWSILEYGNPTKELAYLCEIAKKKAGEFEFINNF